LARSSDQENARQKKGGVFAELGEIRVTAAHGRAELRAWDTSDVDVLQAADRKFQRIVFRTKDKGDIADIPAAVPVLGCDRNTVDF